MAKSIIDKALEELFYPTILSNGFINVGPFSGALFVFTNRRRSGLRILTYDGQGFWLCYKRLSSGRLDWWPGPESESLSHVSARQLQTLLWNGDPESAGFAE